MWLQEVKTVLEILYFCSGILIAVVACVGLKQLRIAKKSIAVSAELAQTSAKREAFKVTAEQCDRYYKEIIPLFNSYYHWKKEHHLESVAESVGVKVSKDGISLIIKNVEESKMYPSVAMETPFLALANALEGFSVFFTTGVAAEQMAFSSIGHTFCDGVESLAPALILLGEKNHFQHVLRLFHMWWHRIEAEKIAHTQRELQERLAGCREIKIKPIGT